LLRQIKAIQHERTWQTSFSGWLYRIAHNLVIDHYRRRGRDTQVPIDDLPMLPSHSEGPEHAAERALTAETLRMARANEISDAPSALALLISETKLNELSKISQIDAD
jgi:DNA-directed RNA polymerase specialized sigma24 family protein